MHIKFFFLSIVVVGLQFTSCKKVNQQDKNSDTEITTNDLKEPSESKTTQNSAEEILAKPQIPVLCYHRIEEGKESEYKVTPATFSSHIQILADSGYQSVLPDELYDYLVYNKELPEKPFMITFDDSRAEHATVAAPVLEKHGFRGVFFIMTITYNKKNYMTTEQIAALSKAGHTIGLHSWVHTMAIKYIEDEDWKKNVIDPKKKLEEIIGKPVDYWAYPYGLCNSSTAQEMSKYFKLSFILSTKRDSIQPLQTVRRMITPEKMSPQGLLRSMNKTFSSKKPSSTQQ
jgi:peptidoglycan/xylan/chitin deacetylase (PgdA/CDA1 family)